MCKDERDKTNGLTSPPNDAIIWTEIRLITASMILPVFLKTLVCGPAGVWTHDLPLSKPALIQQLR